MLRGTGERIRALHGSVGVNIGGIRRKYDLRRLIAVAITASFLTIPTGGPAVALPIDRAPGQVLTAMSGEGGVEHVAFRRFGGFRGGGFRRGGFGGFRRGGFGGVGGGFGGRGRRGFGGGRFYGGRHFGYGGYGVGPGIAGLAAGAIIGGTIAAAAQTDRSVGYCRSRFKSYNAATGTYLGYDGLRHRCP